jgi:putative restriction endonuclease
MKYWWVNQNKTYRHEVDAGYLWAPQSGVWHHEILCEMQPGDLVFSFKDTFISAIGVVQKKAEPMIKPDFGSQGENWADLGWCVETEYLELERPFKPSDYMPLIEPLLPEKYSPLQSGSGRGNQIYLTSIPPLLGDLLFQLSRQDIHTLGEEFAPSCDAEVDEAIQYEIQAKGIQGDLEKVQITKARRGQGIFRTNVRLLEHSCRLTGVKNIKHLRASHIKPWKDSNDQEKIDGNNGLLLSPHVDHLFDRGFISFKNSGDLIISKELNPVVLEQWALDKVENVGSFNPKQSEFLEFHRDSVFKAS